MENILLQFIELFLDDKTTKNLFFALSHYKIDSFLVFHRRNKQQMYKIMLTHKMTYLIEKYENIIDFENINIFRLVTKYIPNKYISKYKLAKRNYFNEICSNGYNDTLMLLKKECPEKTMRRIVFSVTFYINHRFAMVDIKLSGN